MFTKTELFPEILYQSRIDLTEEQREALWDVCEVREYAKCAPGENVNGTSNIYHYSDIPDYRKRVVERLPELIVTLMSHARVYMEDCLGAPLVKDDRLIMKHINCVVIPPGGSVPSHTHFYNGPSFLTGSFCLEDGGGNTRLAIQGPRYLTTEPLTTKYTTNTNEHYLYPKAGDLLIWNSHLSHGIPYNIAPGPMVFLWYDVDYRHGQYPIDDRCIVRGN